MVVSKSYKTHAPNNMHEATTAITYVTEFEKIVDLCTIILLW